MSEVKIAEVLFSYYQKLLKHYPEGSILGVFLYGSQNYQFSWEGSDIDAKAIYIPSKEEIALLKKPVSKEYQFNGAHVEVKDIRLMWQMWKKQNMNFVEILFTNYYLTYKWYTDKWETILRLKEQIATYDMQYGITSACHQAINTLRGNEINGKKVANAARLADFIWKYMQGKSYVDCIKVDENFKNKWLPVKQDNRIYLSNDLVVKGLIEQFNIYLDLATNCTLDKDKQDYLDKKMAAIIISLIEIRKGHEFSML